MEKTAKSRREKSSRLSDISIDPGTDIMSIVKGYDLPVEFSQKIMKQVENVSNEVSAADMAGAWICETGRRSQSMGGRKRP